MTRGSVLIILAIFLLAACGPTQADRAEADVQEAALRWAFTHAETDLDPPAAYCIVISIGSPGEELDPDGEFLERFAGHPVPVRPLSACRIEEDSYRSVVDTITGGHGLLFILHPVVWEGSSEVRVMVAYLQGSLWGTGWRCTARRTDPERWEIATCETVSES